MIKVRFFGFVINIKQRITTTSIGKYKRHTKTKPLLSNIVRWGYTDAVLYRDLRNVQCVDAMLGWLKLRLSVLAHRFVVAEAKSVATRDYGIYIAAVVCFGGLRDRRSCAKRSGTIY